MTEQHQAHVAAQKNDPSFANIYQELVWRGLIQVSTDEEALEKVLAGEPITYYCGFDPTAPSLHLGNLVQILVLRRLQLAGHHPLGLVGGSTGLIGDPRQSAERVLNTREVVNEWVGYLRGQIKRFLSFEGENAARMVNNLDWTANMSALDFLRDIGKYFRVGTMIRKDTVAQRLSSEEGISYTEFSYQVLQGMDYLNLYRDYDCVLQTGGSDQWGNLTSGTDLIRRVEGGTAHAFGTPLITNSDGSKFGKSEGNAIWLDADMCSPYTFYQFWLNTADADVVDRLKVFTFLPREEIEAYAQKVETEAFRREAQKRLAWEVTTLVHGEQAAQAAIDASQALFGSGDLLVLPADTVEAVLTELGGVKIDSGSTIVDVLVAVGISKSKSEARRSLKEGAIHVNNVKVEDPDTTFTVGDGLASQTQKNDVLVVRRGRRTLAGGRLI